MIRTLELDTVPEVALMNPVQVFAGWHLALQSCELMLRTVFATPAWSVVSEPGLNEPVTSVVAADPEIVKLTRIPVQGAPEVSDATAVTLNVSLHVFS